jgi:hypothetical protein
MSKGITMLAVLALIFGVSPGAADPPLASIRQVEVSPTLAPAQLARLANDPVAAFEAEGRLIVLARHRGMAPGLMGMLSGTFRPIGAPDAGLWALVFEVAALDRAIFDIIVTADGRPFGYVQFRGRRLAPAPQGPLRAGRVESLSFNGRQSGLTRTLFVYRPNRGPVERLLVALDISDASSSMLRRIDQLAAEGRIGPVAVVGVTPARAEGPATASALRLQEMWADDNPAIYRAFERLIFADLLPAFSAEFRIAGAGRVAVIGASASAGWVLDQATRHGGSARTWGAFAVPDGPLGALPGPASGTIFMGGGTFDAEYLARTRVVCGAIRRGGGHCRFAAVHSGHGQGAWDELTTDLLIEWERSAAIR